LPTLQRQELPDESLLLKKKINDGRRILAIYDDFLTGNWRLPILQVFSPPWKKYVGDL
jgi:hypothetical protein